MKWTRGARPHPTAKENYCISTNQALGYEKIRKMHTNFYRAYITPKLKDSLGGATLHHYGTGCAGLGFSTDESKQS